MCTEISLVIDADFFGFLEEPGKVVPEIWAVANSLGDHVAHFVDGDKGDDFLVHERLVAVLSLSETKMHFLALVDTVGRVLGIGGGLFKAVRIRLKVSL